MFGDWHFPKNILSKDSSVNYLRSLITLFSLNILQKKVFQQIWRIFLKKQFLLNTFFHTPRYLSHKISVETSFWEFHFFQKIFFLIILAELNGVEKENRKMMKKNVFQHLLLTSNVILEKKKIDNERQIFFLRNRSGTES